MPAAGAVGRDGQVTDEKAEAWDWVVGAATAAQCTLESLVCFLDDALFCDGRGG